MSKGASVPEQALVSDQAAARLDPPGFDPSRDTMFSQRAKVMMAIEGPGEFVPRIARETFIEHDLHWKTRAVFKAMWEIGWRPAIAIAAGTDETPQAVQPAGQERGPERHRHKGA